MENIESSKLILVLIIGILAIDLVFMFLKYKKSTKIAVKSDKPSRAKKSIKLLSKEGVLLYEYKDVYLSRWDTNMYDLSYEYEGKSFIRIDKGVDMLLLVESYQDENTKELENV
jgi:hypothetical protein